LIAFVRKPPLPSDTVLRPAGFTALVNDVPSTRPTPDTLNEGGAGTAKADVANSSDKKTITLFMM
jgi:hypothetical protein